MTDIEPMLDAEEREFEGFEAAVSLFSEGLYPATITAMVQRRIPSKFSESEDGRDWATIWTFTVETVTKPDGSPATVDGTTSTSLGARSKNAKWLGALGLEASPSTRPKDIIGRECTVYVKLKESGFAKVEDVLPPQTANAPRRAAPAAEVAPGTTPPPSAAQEPPETFSDGFPLPPPPGYER